MIRTFALIFFICYIQLSCKPVAYFNTSNDVLKTNATVHMVDNTEQTGAITIQFETDYQPKDFIILSNNNIDEKIPVLNIKYYKINNDYYFLKKIDIDMNGYKRLLFVKRLTPEHSRMDLFELLQSKNHSPSYADTYYYFISFPADGRLDAMNLADKKFTPNFNEKMSRLVSDCPALALKIQQKQKGYFLPQVNLLGNKKAEIYLNIINEYNQCK